MDRQELEVLLQSTESPWIDWKRDFSDVLRTGTKHSDWEKEKAKLLKDLVSIANTIQDKPGYLVRCPQRFFTLADLGQDGICILAPPKHLGILIVESNIIHDGSLQLLYVLEHPSSDSLVRELTEESLHSVEPGGRGGCEMEMEARMLTQPVLDVGGLVGSIVVYDQMEIQPLRCFLVDPLEESQELLLSVFGHTLADHFPIEEMEGRKEGSRAMSLVVMGHRTGTALLHRQPRLRAIQCLNLALFIHA